MLLFCSDLVPCGIDRGKNICSEREREFLDWLITETDTILIPALLVSLVCPFAFHFSLRVFYSQKRLIFIIAHDVSLYFSINCQISFQKIIANDAIFWTILNANRRVSNSWRFSSLHSIKTHPIWDQHSRKCHTVQRIDNEKKPFTYVMAKPVNSQL